MAKWVWALSQIVLAIFSGRGKDALRQGLAGNAMDLTIKDGCRPQKVCLALTNDPTEMRVSWSTAKHNCHGHIYFGKLDNSIESENYMEMVVDHKDGGSYSADDLCGKPAVNDEFDPPHLHTAIMSNLNPGGMYKYRIDHHTEIRHFRAALESSSEDTFTMIAYGDMGESRHKKAKSPGAHLTADKVNEEVQKWGASLVVHLGDISYADGVHKVWDAFLEQVEPYASRAPYQVVVGNHEYDWKTGKEKKHHHPTDASGKEEMYNPDWGNYGNDSGGECGVIFSKLFTMPGSEFVQEEIDRTEAANHRSDVPNPPFWYSYDYGSVHFMTLSSEHDLTHGSHQRKWFKRDLESVDRCETPWLVVLIHRPMYVVHPHHSNRIVGEHLRESLEDLLEKYEVDLVMSGHVHAYARTCNLFDLQCIKNKKGGTTHITLGNGGHKLAEVKHEQPSWLEFAERKFGYARITVKGSKSFLVEYISSETGDVRDSVRLKVEESAMQKCSTDKLEIGKNGSMANSTEPKLIT